MLRFKFSAAATLFASAAVGVLLLLFSLTGAKF
jgi:hypothetical protein